MKRETHPNPHVVTYHSRKRFINGLIETFDSKDWRDVQTADENGGGMVGFMLKLLLGHAGQKYMAAENRERLALGELVDEIFAINGVEHVNFGQFRISVRKGEAFSWEELEPAVIEALKRHGYGEDAAEELRSA